MSGGNRQRGFVLLMVLAVLVLAGAVLAMAARQSCRRAIEAAEAQRRLQKHWGLLSVKATILPQAERLLSLEETQQERPAVQLRRELELGDMRFTLAITDEHAKANANLLEDRHGRPVLLAYLTELGSGALIARPRPHREPERLGMMAPMTYESYDMLFALNKPADLLDFSSDTPSPVDHVTCWSDGRVNFRRAHRRSLRAVTRGVLTEAELTDLLEFRRRAPGASVDEAIRHLKLDDDRVAQAARLLTDVSRCHALWVTTGDEENRQYRLYVSRGAGGGAAANEWSFAW